MVWHYRKTKITPFYLKILNSLGFLFVITQFNPLAYYAKINRWLILREIFFSSQSILKHISCQRLEHNERLSERADNLLKLQFEYCMLFFIPVFNAALALNAQLSREFNRKIRRYGFKDSGNRKYCTQNQYRMILSARGNEALNKLFIW